MTQAYKLAKGEVGTWEWSDGSNPVIDAYFQDAGFDGYTDETAWCAAFVGAMIKRSGGVPSGSLAARSYLNVGVPVDDPVEGDIVVYWRGNPDGWQGHVGFFVRREGSYIVTLGGNQKDQVNESRYSAGQLLGYRRIKPPRSNPMKSTTLQATAATATAGATGVAAMLAALSPAAQIIVLVCASVGLFGLGWIARERLKRWARGDK